MVLWILILFALILGIAWRFWAARHRTAPRLRPAPATDPNDVRLAPESGHSAA